MDANIEGNASSRGQGKSRLRMFALVVCLTCLIGWSFTFLRPAIYQSSATVMVAVPPTERNESVADNPAERVALHSHVLTSQPLLDKIRIQLSQDRAAPDTTTELREMLIVVPVDDTNIVELRAEGSEPGFLPILINTWIDSYLSLRAESQIAAADSEFMQQEQQRLALETKIKNKRLELDQFRRENNIITLGENENQVLARLKGMSDALNKASEDEVTAAANLNAIKQAAANNKPVESKQNQRSMAALETRAVQLREQLREMQQQFTPEYMQLDPLARSVRHNLKLVEDKINDKLSLSAHTAMSEAEQALNSARQRVQTLKQQLNDYKQVASDFTTRFSEHEARKEELLQLEQLYRDVKERIVQIQVRNEREFPQVEVIERATLPEEPVRPHYLRDAGITVLVAIALGLLAIWLLEFLFRPRQTSTSTPTLRQMFYAIVDPRALPEQTTTPAPLTQSHMPALEQELPRELSGMEVRQLIDSAEPSTTALIALLLSGVDLKEAAALSWQDISIKEDKLELKTTIPRSLLLSADVLEFFRHPDPASEQQSIWSDQEGKPLPMEEMEALITCSIYDAGLAQAAELNSHSLRHTYLAYLARQGLRLSEFHKLCGQIQPSTLSRYGEYSSPGSGKSLDETDTTYPALR
jgi:uncharacterized protein involved in exopolysaccharide biosynthesis